MKIALKKILFVTVFTVSSTTIFSQTTTKNIDTSKEQVTVDKKTKKKEVKKSTLDFKNSVVINTDKKEFKVLIDSKGEQYFINRKGKKEYLKM